MGNHCSAAIISHDDCLTLREDPNASRGPACGNAIQLCGDDSGTPVLTGPHPLLLVDDTSKVGLPQTPRGPTPPWALSLTAPSVDLTATGRTPPRSPTPTRAAPPGIPEEASHDRGAANAAALAASFDIRFVQDLFHAVRNGSASTLSSMLHQVAGGAFTLLSSKASPVVSGASTTGDAFAAERREKATEMVSSFLSHVHAPDGADGETLLSVAAANGQNEVLHLLLASRADPTVCDEHGCSVLHRAAESGRLLPVLLVLDRLQANARSINVSEIINNDGETPEMYAALAGASEVCHAFEVFANMQSDAELRQLGSSRADFAGGNRGPGTGDLVSFLDVLTDPQTGAGQTATALLRSATAGTGLVCDIFAKVPEEPHELHALVDHVCQGVRSAEATLLSTTWNLVDPDLDPAARAFVATAEIRSSWQKLRVKAVEAGGFKGIDDFWQTHLSAETMASALQNSCGDTFQLLLTVLWLFTREAWLRHIMDTLAGALSSARVPEGGAAPPSAEGTTGATPNSAPQVPASLRAFEPLIQALSPLMQLVQSALWWFEEAGIRHPGVTYRPLSLPILGLQRLIDRYTSAQRDDGKGSEGDGKEQDGTEFHKAAWVALGGGAFFSSMSNKLEAMRRLTRSRCNVMLLLRPDERDPCLPKQMSLRGNAVDDVIFPLGGFFRITRITRTSNADLDPEFCKTRESGARGLWPVMVIELASANRPLQALEMLENRGALAPNEFEASLRRWAAGPLTSGTTLADRLLVAGEFMLRYTAGVVEPASAKHSLCTPDSVSSLLAWALSLAEASGDTNCIARALLSIARCRRLLTSKGEFSVQSAADGARAIKMLTEANGPDHPETSLAREAWKQLGVNVS